MPLRDLLRSHPFLATLRWIKRPKPGSSIERTVEALCRVRDGVRVTDDDVEGLPSDRALAKELGIAEPTVRANLVTAARGVQGLEHFRTPRARIWLVYWHTKWLEGLPPDTVREIVARARADTPPTGRVA